MIRLASSITEDWDPQSMPFYLELYGEDEPLIDTTFAEALPAGTTAGKYSPTFTNAAPVYEYWWTLGFHRDPAPEKKFLRLMRARHGARDDGEAENETRERFAEPAAHVGIFFPTHVNWRVKEVTATLKFLTPLRDQHPIWQDISGNIAKLSPVLTDAASVAGLVPGGAVASTALSTVAKLQVDHAHRIPDKPEPDEGYLGLSIRPRYPPAGRRRISKDHLPCWPSRRRRAQWLARCPRHSRRRPRSAWVTSRWSNAPGTHSGAVPDSSGTALSRGFPPSG
jgi:hypothetical protein